MYQVTATRCRPQTFDELLGQEFVSATLKKSIEAGKIANAYLFSGPRGCGKTSTARILAKAINCVKGPTATPCGVCDCCVQITNGSSFDVLEIDGASNTGVDDIRKLKDEILFPPTNARYKVYIIDEVHMLSTNAFNALLKTIEEPPPYVVFIFATTELHKVPATIKSRCQQFNFRLIDVQVLHDALLAISNEQNIKVDDEALFWIARESTGSLRDCYTLFDQIVSFSDGHITLEKIQDKLGLTSIEVLNTLVTACVQKNSNEALGILHDCLSSGVSVEQFTIDIAKYFRSLLLVKHGIKKESVLGQNAKRFSPEVINAWTSTQIERALSMVLQLFKDISYSINPTYELELLVSRLAWLSDYVPPDELKKAYDSLKNLFEGNLTSTLDPEENITTTENLNRTKNSESNSSINHKEQIDGPKPQMQTVDEKAFTENTNSEIKNPTNTNEAEHKKNSRAFNTLDELKDFLVKEFNTTNTLLSHTLNETFAWEKVGSVLTLQTEKSFNKATLEKNKAFLLEALKDYFADANITFKIKLIKVEQNENISDTKEPPAKIKNIMHTFQARLVDERNA